MLAALVMAALAALMALMTRAGRRPRRERGLAARTPAWRLAQPAR
jgi:hypothetical protein